ncbi:glycosyl hydrolase [Bifidobacterium adolescentis]|uniref:GH26 domain-containing protein n=1 Tax=Bifidobacterium adolescentis L2-32 TaxID=411481 RepID=A7A8D2_BIFAD|nr:glycosyl hydrolase [Bifidobacterium adolescentis]EDN81996.1 hypothetical protein BIFADO_02122 [Bifidobacterium adolescentis L2-32]
MKTTVTKLLATVAATSTIFGMSTLPAFAAEGKSASNGNSVNISDVNATAETRALFDKLKNSGKGDLRFGQQHTTDENISSSASQGDVYEMTGKYPAVFGWDAGLALRGAEKPGSGADKNANAKALAQNITDADSKGAIVTLSAHWYTQAPARISTTPLPLLPNCFPAANTPTPSTRSSTPSPPPRSRPNAATAH